jgi:hypothetical protein
VRLDQRDPDLHYCVTWGAERYAAGILRWWHDIQRLANEPARLYDRFEDWAELVATIGTVGGTYEVADDATGAVAPWIFNAEGVRLGRLAVGGDLPRRAREPDEALRTRLVHAVGGLALADVDEDPREGLAEEPVSHPLEPRSKHDRLIEEEEIV